MPEQVEQKIDYTRPPVAYLVRAGDSIGTDGTLSAAGRRQAEDAARFLSYERIGAVVSSPEFGAVETAESIFFSCDSTAGAVEIDEDLERSLQSYLRPPFPTPGKDGAPAPVVIVWSAISQVPTYLPGVHPGGIISVHLVEDSASSGELKAVARTRAIYQETADVGTQ